ncbi:MAG TPA: MFS transporter, partial [Xanthobacteraceae bacterium]|nr:MFS transporter [Xanthobacteraceae bacterium]
MSDSSAAPNPGAAPHHDLNVPLFVAVIAHTVTVNFVVSLARVTTSYRAIELDLSVFWIGVIAGAFSLVPVFAAVWVGRFIDRGHDALSAWIGAGMMLAACAGFRLWPTTATSLLVFSTVLGFGHMFCMASHQMISVRCAGPISRENVFGYHMIAIAIGQGMGPMLLGWLGGDAKIPPTELLFGIAFAVSGLSLAVAFGLRPAPREAETDGPREHVSVASLLADRSLTMVLLASVVTVTAFELLIVYLPLLGTERHIETRDVGMLLAVRSLVSIISRIFYARLLMAVGRLRLMVSCMAIGAAAFLLMGLPVSLPLMYLAIVAMGFGLGIAATLTFSEVVLLAPRNARATALSLRLTGNRIGQLLVPILASLL